MPRKRGRWLLVVAGALLVSLLAWATAAASQASERGTPMVLVDLAVGVADDAVVYSLTLKNTSSSEVADVFVAGSVPSDAVPMDAIATPPGSWFRGFEAAGTPLHSAVWLAQSIPANGTLGPFIYRVGKGQASDLTAHGWARWLRPQEGTASSPEVGPASTPVLGMALGGRFHTIHTGKLGLQCAACHVQEVEGYQDPLAQVFNLADKKACLTCHGGARIFYGEDWQRSSVSR